MSAPRDPGRKDFAAADDVGARLRESEAQYRLLFDRIYDGFCVIEVLFDENDRPFDYRFLKVNPAFEEQTGLRDAVGRTILAMAPEHEPFWAETYGRIVRTGRPERFEHRADALGRWYEVNATPVGGSGDNQVAVVFRDVLQRRKAEEALRASEAKYRSLFETMGQGYGVNEVVRDADGRAVDLRYLELNPAFERLTGASVKDARGRLASEVFLGLEHFWIDMCDRVAATGVSEHVEHQITPGGRWYRSSLYPGGGDLVLSLYEDITERKRAEAILRGSEERQAFLLKLSDTLRSLSDADLIGQVAIDMMARHLGVDRCYIARFSREDEKGWVGPEFRSSGLPALTGEYRFADFPEVVKRMETSPLVISDGFTDPSLSEADRQSYQMIGLRAVLTAPLRRGEGNAVWSLTAATTQPRDWTDGELELLEDVAERTWAAIERARADTALRESEEKYRSLFDSMDEAFAIVELVRDADGRGIDYRYVELNPALVRHVGISPEILIGRRASEVFGTVDPWLIETYSRVVDEGQSVLAEHHFAHVDRWLRINLFPRGGERLAALYSDVSDRHRAQAVLRESEARQAFLLRFTDAIRSEPDEQALIERAVRMLAEELAVDRAYATRHHPREDLTHVVFEVRGAGLEPLPATLRFSDFPEAGRQTFERTLVFEDTAKDPALTEVDKASLAGMGVAAFLSRPLRTDGSPIFALGVVSATARRWTPTEIALVEEATERTWEAAERARFESALRESEARYRDLFNSMDEAYAVVDVLKNEAGEWADFRFVDANPAFLAHTGMPWPVGRTATEILGTPNPRWSQLYGQALDTGEAIRVEEVEPTLGRVFDLNIFSLDRDRDRVAVLFTDITERKRAEARQRLLLEELQHRVRNTLGIVRSIARRTAETAETVEDYAAHLDGRLNAFSRTQAAVTRDPEGAVDLAEIVAEELRAHGANEGPNVLIDGPPFPLRTKAAETLGLAIHELTTNAVKYGALSRPGGRLEVRWRCEADEVTIEWAESGLDHALSPPTRRGFGSELLERTLAYELGAETLMEWRPHGLHYRARFPKDRVTRRQA